MKGINKMAKKTLEELTGEFNLIVGDNDSEDVLAFLEDLPFPDCISHPISFILLRRRSMNDFSLSAGTAG